MISKIPLFGFVLVTLQIVSSYGDAGVDSLKKVCDAPALAGKGNERIRTTEVSAPADVFLSKSVKNIPAICMGNNMVYRFNVEEPSKDDAVMQTARAAIGETSPEAVEAAKAELVELLKKDTSLNVPLDNSAWLVRFLRKKNYDVPATYEFIKIYYNFKARNAKLLDGLSPSKVSKIAESNIFMTLPKRGQDGKMIAVLTPRNFDPKKYSATDAFKMTVVLSELAAYEPATQIAGSQYIIDASGMSMNQVSSLSPAIAKKFVDHLLYAAPYKYDKFHVVKQSRVFSAMWKILSPFITKDMKKKIYFHGNNMKSLHRHINPAVLPTAFGGSLPMPAFTGAEWSTQLKGFDDEYAKINTYGVKKN